MWRQDRTYFSRAGDKGRHGRIRSNGQHHQEETARVRAVEMSLCIETGIIANLDGINCETFSIHMKQFVRLPRTETNDEKKKKKKLIVA